MYDDPQPMRCDDDGPVIDSIGIFKMLATFIAIPTDFNNYESRIRVPRPSGLRMR